MITLRQIVVLIILISFPILAFSQVIENKSLIVDSLNESGYNQRLTDPEKTLNFGKAALDIAQSINYTKGIAEANRMIGMGFYYLGKNDKAIAHYLISLSTFKIINDIKGQAKLYNNIGNLYKDVNYNKALAYFQKAIVLAKKENIKDIVAGCYLNIGIINYRKKNYKTALKNSQDSYNLFLEINNAVGTTLALQNQGVLYNSLSEFEKAEKYLLEANKKAKEIKLHTAVASIDLTLVSIYLVKDNYTQAYKYLNEGKYYSVLGKSTKLQSDFLKTSYELENKHKNYKQALIYLKELYTQDSIELQNTISRKFGLFEEQSKFASREKEAAVKLEKAKTTKILLIASITISFLALILIFLLFKSVKKKALTNKLLQILNEEISIQKENLNQVNHNQELIIDERTKDLKVKNRKLAEYSSHLSHQIRSPIATMKGLLILEQENLIESEEFVDEVTKCVNEIDDKIININAVLHDLSTSGLIPRIVDKEKKS